MANISMIAISSKKLHSYGVSGICKLESWVLPDMSIKLLESLLKDHFGSF